MSGYMPTMMLPSVASSLPAAEISLRLPCGPYWLGVGARLGPGRVPGDVRRLGDDADHTVGAGRGLGHLGRVVLGGRRQDDHVAEGLPEVRHGVLHRRDEDLGSVDDDGVDVLAAVVDGLLHRPDRVHRLVADVERVGTRQLGRRDRAARPEPRDAGFGDHGHDRLGEERERADDRHHALVDRLPGTGRRHGRVELLVADGDLERPAGDAAASVDVVGIRVGGVGDVLVGRPGGVERGHGHDLDRIAARCLARRLGGRLSGPRSSPAGRSRRAVGRQRRRGVAAVSVSASSSSSSPPHAATKPTTAMSASERRHERQVGSRTRVSKRGHHVPPVADITDAGRAPPSDTKPQHVGCSLPDAWHRSARAGLGDGVSSDGRRRGTIRRTPTALRSRSAAWASARGGR